MANRIQEQRADYMLTIVFSNRYVYMPYSQPKNHKERLKLLKKLRESNSKPLGETV